LLFPYKQSYFIYGMADLQEKTEIAGEELSWRTVAVVVLSELMNFKRANWFALLRSRTGNLKIKLSTKAAIGDILVC
jgi:hypothetical protein